MKRSDVQGSVRHDRVFSTILLQQALQSTLWLSESSHEGDLVAFSYGILNRCS